MRLFMEMALIQMLLQLQEHKAMTLIVHCRLLLLSLRIVLLLCSVSFRYSNFF